GLLPDAVVCFMMETAPHPIPAHTDRDAISPRRAWHAVRGRQRPRTNHGANMVARPTRQRVVGPIPEPARSRVVMSYVVASVIARQEATMKTMKTVFGCAAALLVATTAANAQTTITDRHNPSVVTRDRIELTPAQPPTIYRTVTRDRLRAAEPGFAVRLGARVPQAVELSEIPTAVIEEVP